MTHSKSKKNKNKKGLQGSAEIWKGLKKQVIPCCSEPLFENEANRDLQPFSLSLQRNKKDVSAVQFEHHVSHNGLIIQGNLTHSLNTSKQLSGGL